MSEKLPPADAELVGSLVARMDAAEEVRLGRSLVVFVVSAGECGGCALEWAAVRGVVYGLARFGVSVAETPVGADVLVVMGAMTRSLVAPVQRALAAMGRPRWVMAVGDCAGDGGVFKGCVAVAGGVEAAVPVDLMVPGCPPTPGAMLAGLRALVEANSAD